MIRGVTALSRKRSLKRGFKQRNHHPCPGGARYRGPAVEWDEPGLGRDRDRDRDPGSGPGLGPGPGPGIRTKTRDQESGPGPGSWVPVPVPVPAAPLPVPVRSRGWRGGPEGLGGCGGGWDTGMPAHPHPSLGNCPQQTRPRRITGVNQVV